MRKNLAFKVFSVFLCILPFFDVAPCLSFAKGRFAEEDFQPLTPFLREFSEWDGDVVELLLDEDEGGGVLSRSYTRGEALLEIRIMVGAGVEAYLGGMVPGMLLMESDTVRMERRSFDGFPVVARQEKNRPAGALAVLLSGEEGEASQRGENALALLVYEGITGDEAERLARGMDLQGLKLAVGSFGKNQE